jgi:hypothetical protein
LRSLNQSDDRRPSAPSLAPADPGNVLPKRFVSGEDERRPFEVYRQDLEQQMRVGLAGLVVDPAADISPVSKKKSPAR